MKSRILSCFLIFALCISTLSACGSDTAPSDHSPSSSLQVEISDLQDMMIWLMASTYITAAISLAIS